ncbi:MAG: dihydrodipicolinate synthase family protein [Bacillota bacterium]
MSKNLTGVYPPIITCFTQDGEIYERGIRNVVSFLSEKGVNGLFVIGSYGSFPLMTDDERKRVAEIIFDEVKGRVPVIVHIGSAGTRRSIALARHAQELGAEAVAAVTPFYYSGFAYKETEILNHFEQIVKAVDVPVYLYNNPKTTYYTVSPTTLLKLADVGVQGLKDSSGDLMLFADYLNTVRPKHPDFNFMIGTVGLIQPSYLFGARSCVAGTANVFPELVLELVSKLEQGKHEEAKDLQLKVIQIRKIQAITGFRPAGCYTMLKMRGVDAGVPRLPWRLPNEEETKAMRRQLVEIGML